MTLLLCDVDNLKELNDIRGHHGGDWALKAVAGTLRTAAEALPARARGRLSGDEFGILAEGAGPEAMQRVAEAAIERLSGHRPPVGLSCGIASSRLSAQRPSELLRAADAALYTAKRTGRGRVCVADSDPETRVALDGPPRRPPRPPRRARDRHRRAARAGARRCSTAPCAPPRRWSDSRASRPRSAPRCARRRPRSRCARTAPA